MVCKSRLLCLFLLMVLVLPQVYADNRVLRLVNSTSVSASGLLDVIVPAFEQKSGIRVVASTVGSGKAMRMGRSGKADVLWVHSPEEENEFIRDGHGTQRTYSMHNDFLIACPAQDPAGIRSADSVKQVFMRIVNRKALFVSRADDSGTHVRELALWKGTGIEPYGSWYYEVGLGMKPTLKIAGEKQGYVLVDRGTWLKQRNGLKLEACYEDDPLLRNEYSLIAVSADRHPGVNFQAAAAFIDFVTSDEGRAIISNLKTNDRKMYHLR